MPCFTDIQIKELNKRASGHAFELILRPSTPDAKGEFPLSPLKKKETSLDEIKRKLQAAEERRRVIAYRYIYFLNEHGYMCLGFTFSKLSCHFVRAMRLKCWNTLLRNVSMRRRSSRRPSRTTATLARWHKKNSIRKWRQTKRTVTHEWQHSMRNSKRR